MLARAIMICGLSELYESSTCTPVTVDATAVPCCVVVIVIELMQ